MRFTPDNLKRFDEILARYPVKRSALLPALHLVQEQEGWISKPAMEYVASLLGLTPAQVHDTASFYTMYRFAPEGKRQIGVCTTLSCALHGADELLGDLCGKLGIKPGQTTADGSTTVKAVECLAACGGAVAVQVDGEWVENVRAADLDDLISGKLRYRPFVYPKSAGEMILLSNCWNGKPTDLEAYRKAGGYATLKDHLAKKPEEIVDIVKKSGLRGRGGAGFPTGMKWGFLPKNDAPRYLCVNADEGEPGTYKDRILLERDPHRLIEGCILSAYAIHCRLAFIYVRGEFTEGMRVLQKALDEAYAAGYLGKDILGTGYDLEMYIHSGAGSYECGEETALIESLEGKRGQPRIKPPFPAVSGLYNCPTVVNNVETLVCIPLILDKGPDWFAQYGTEKNGGPKLYCVSGHVKNPGVYEAPMGRITLRQLVMEPHLGGGLREGRQLRAVIPGGSSTPVLTPAEIDINLDFDSLAKAGTLLGSAATIVIDDSTCMVWVAEKLADFYKHESCGKCSPCREGTGWLLRILQKIEHGHGTEKDLLLLVSVAESIMGRTVCAFGDAAATPPFSTIKKFREEYEYHVREKKCWRSVAKTFAEAQALAGQTAGATA